MRGASLAGRDLISLLDYTTEELERLLELAAEVKANPDHYAKRLTGRTLFMYFEKPSLRTRVTFEAGMTQLGGHAIYYTAAEGKIGVRESVEDVARNLERWVDAAMCRTFSHELLLELARFAEIPVINGLTDHLHPCQALADYMTLREIGGDSLAGRRLAYVGDGNNVAHSLMNGGARLGVSVTVITPPGYEPDAGVVETARAAAQQSGATIEITHDIEAVRGANAVYTDVWASMGQEDEAAERKRVFAPYQIHRGVMDLAGPETAFMHCLPAHRGEEVTSEVADMPRSVIFEQAENRLHAQKAVLLALLGGV
ncbi:MAG TPA: ornithine carbamoyltransferase [Candidatus Polarisedimenticolaceae bacterium]|nr:ornithine carbamoyltransferase [Candidatus Polarisedimenticolaceae bacterium]